MNKSRGRPRYISCYDNGVTLLTDLPSQSFFYVEGNQLLKSDTLPQLGKPCSFFELSEQERKQVTHHYSKVWI